MYASPVSPPTLGVHNWVDRHGNSGSELISELPVRVPTARVDGLFDLDGQSKTPSRLASYFDRGPDLPKRKACVVVSDRLSRTQQDKVEEYFNECREWGLLEDHYILRLSITTPTDKDMTQVFSVVTAAERLALRRRDLFVAIGDKDSLDVVGFAAAIYRRSTPWIFIPTDLIGLIHCSSCLPRLNINYRPYQEAKKIYEGLFSLSHPPIAGLCDPSFIARSLGEADINNGLAEIVRIAAIHGGPLLDHVETLVGQFASAVDETAASLLVSAAWASCTWLANTPLGLGPTLGVEAAIASVKEALGDHGQAESTSIGISLTCAVLFLHDMVTAAEFERVLKLFKHANLPVYDGELNSERLRESMIQFAGEHGGPLVGIFLGKPVGLDLAQTVSVEGLWAVDEAIKKHFNADGIDLSRSENGNDTPVNELVSQTLLTVRYHVATVPNVLHFSNSTLFGYCCQKRVLVVVDAHLRRRVTDLVRRYFHGRVDFRLLDMHVSSIGKDTTSTMKVIDCALDFGMTRHDLFVVIGGGTIMDVVGFAAHLYKGGTPYLRIPTTLVGMIDAGVGVKVGVNFGTHKNFIGGYHAPVACLNDASTFLPTLPSREYACGLAEAIKMALIKSQRLFDVIREHQRDLVINEYTDEVIRLSIQTMLEELQPNLREESLIRLVDFGHEFGHIIESLANFTIPHGECVSMGMAISSYLAYLKGRFSKSDLEQALQCLMSLGLPIATECDVGTIWKKISTGGIEHKDGKLYLAVPTEIGKGGFIDDIFDISEKMLGDVMLSLFSQSNQRVHSPGQSDKTRERFPDKLWSSTSPNIDSASHPSTPPSSSSSSSSSPTSLTVSTVPSHSSPHKAAVIGASGDIGSNFAQYLVENGVDVAVSVRASSLELLKRRNSAVMRVIPGHPLDRANLEAMLRDVDVLYNMAAIVSLSTKPEDASHVIALNGFGQGIIASVIKHAGREQDVTVVYPSSQRVHLLEADPAVDEWIHEAAEFYRSHEALLLAEPNYTEMLENLARKLLALCPLPPGHNTYEISKRLGEVLMSSLPRHSILRISGVYGPGFRRGFVSRAVNPVPGRKEEAEIRDFIYIDDLNELLLKASNFTGVYDAASGEEISLEEVWKLAGEEARANGRAHPVQTFDGTPRTPIRLDVAFARKLLDREFVPFREGLERTARGSPGHQDSLDRNGRDRGRRTSVATPYSPFGRPAIFLDIGSTYMRTAIMTQEGLIDISCVPSPSKHKFPDSSLAELQANLISTIVQATEDAADSHPELSLRDLGISIGAVVSDGVVLDASIFWGETARGYDLQLALSKRLPAFHILVVNDISAAAWRYKDEGRFCLITLSSGLSNKVFNSQLDTPDKLEVGAHGTGGEMGHVLVDPRAVDNMIRMAISQAFVNPEGFSQSLLASLTGGDAQKIDAQHLATAAKRSDGFSLRIADKADVPVCTCGNLADLCSYSSGRGALRQARRLASSFGVDAADVTDEWLHRGIAMRHPLAVCVLGRVVYPLALRILQLAADLGLDKFILTGGFVTKTAKGAFLPALQQQLRRFMRTTGFFSGWIDADLTSFVRIGYSDDSDGLIGMSNLIRHLQAQHLAIEKPIGAASLAVVSRPRPRCGALEVLAKVLYAGIYSTDLQILRGERGLEPVVLGHEGVCQVVDLGSHVRGLQPGDIFVLLPNNPLDDHEKIGHNREGLFQEYIKFGQEFIDRRQVLPLSTSAPTATHTLIEPLSCVLAAQELIKNRIAGKNILIVGAGALGRLFAIVNSGIAANVFVANRSRGRLDSAIAHGIVKPENAFVANDMATKIHQVSQGEGVDVVVICVSLGEGKVVAQEALGYVNSGGCIYLFGGFLSSDVLDTGDSKVLVWPIRTCWKTERVSVNGKSVELVGHRGSRETHVIEAAKMIEERQLSFGRVVSHTVSLSQVPQVMELMGSNVSRVVIDMTRSEKSAKSHGHELVSPAERPWRYFEAQANLPPSQVDDIALEGHKPILGFAHPPSWDHIRRAVEPVLRMRAIRAKKHHVWVGTGAWGFMMALIKDLASSESYKVLQTLDPSALSTLISTIQLESTVCIGISQSGKTIETVMLMDTLRELFDSAGLDYRNHFVWITDTYQHVLDTECGEAVLRSRSKHLWADADFVPVNVPGHGAINAMFSIPHSTPMFLALSILLGMDVTRRIYQEYVCFRHDVNQSLLPTAYSVALNNTNRLNVEVDSAILTPAMENLVIQLIEQALGSKSDGFNPRVDVKSTLASNKAIIAVNARGTAESEAKHADGSGDESVPQSTASVHHSTPLLPITKAMLTMNALSVFVAAIAHHRRINFVSHPRVAFYKQRALSLFNLPSFGSSGMRVVTTSEIADIVRVHSQQDEQVQVLRYGGLNQGPRDDFLGLCADGETWNHSRYQAAHAGYLHVIVVPERRDVTIRGIKDTTLQANMRMLRAIAQATQETLPRSLIFHVLEN